MEKTVRDYWVEGKGWKWEKFSQALLASWLIKLTEIVLDLTGGGQDKVGWLESIDRRFTVRSAYLLLRRNTSKNVWRGWRLIWKLRAQEQSKVFMWLVAHDRVFSNWVRWRRQLDLSPHCARCDEAKENALHAVRDWKIQWRHGFCLYHPCYVETSLCFQFMIGY